MTAAHLTTPQNTKSEGCFETRQNRSPEVILSTLGPMCATRPFEGPFWDPIWGGPPCFTRVFGFDCGEGLIWGGGPACFTTLFGFDCGEGLEFKWKNRVQDEVLSKFKPSSVPILKNLVLHEFFSRMGPQRANGHNRSKHCIFISGLKKIINVI